MSRNNMTKQQPSDTKLRPSRLCQILIIALVLKLGLLGGLAYESLWSKDSLKDSFSVAYAFEAAGAPAAPESIQSPLPDAGMTTVSPEEKGLSATDGGLSTYTPQEERSLPAIGQRRGIGSEDGQELEAKTTEDNIAREALVRKQDELARKEEELKSLEKEISAKLEDMRVLESRLQIMMQEAKGTTDEKLKHLVDVLSNMKARQAAAVLETLDQRIGVKILANMRGRQAGEILTFVNPQKAARLAESLSRMQMPLE